MLSVFLAILKIIGIILLCLLLFLLFILAVVLFVSLRYDIKAEKGDNLSVDVRVNWLFKIVRGYVTIINGVQTTSVKVLWFEVSDRNKTKKDAGTDAKDIFSEEEFEREADVKTEPETAPEGKEKREHTRKKRAERKEKKKKSSNREKADKEKVSFFERIKQIKDKADYLLNYPDRKKIQAYTIELLAGELKALKPKIFKISGVIGFEDPSVTGKLLGAISVVSALSGLKMYIRGNFEEPVIEINARAAGKVSVWMLLFPIIKYVFKKPIWKIVKPIIFRKDEGNGNSVEQQS